MLIFSRLFIFRFLSSKKKVFVFTDTVGIVMRKSENYIPKHCTLLRDTGLENVRDLESCIRDRA